MLWRGRDESSNVDDRCGISGGGLAVCGGIGDIIIAVIYVLLGSTPSNLPQQSSTSVSNQQEMSTEQKHLMIH